MEQQMAALLNERSIVIEQIERDHPGYKWTDPEGLVPQRVESEESKMEAPQ
jgi:hypothetical protein